MAGGYGVMFFGRWPLPNFIPENGMVALAAQWTHRVTAYVIVIVWLCHLMLAPKHQFVNRDRHLNRMLPFTAQ